MGPISDSLYHAIVKHVADSLAATQQTTKSSDADVMTKLRDFYDVSWNHLLAVAGVIGTVAFAYLGFAFPIYQNWKLKRDEKKLQEDFESKIENAKAALKVDFDTKVLSAQEDLRKKFADDIDNRTKEQNQKLDEQIHYVEGLMIVIFGVGQQRDGKIEEATYSFFYGLKFLLQAKSTDNINSTLEFLSDIAKTLRKKSLPQIFRRAVGSIAEYFKEVAELAIYNKEVSQKISELKTAFENLPE